MKRSPGGVAACCVLLGGGLFCVNFAGGVAEAEAFEGVEDLAVCFWIGIFGLVEKAVVVFEAGVECGIESCKDYAWGGAKYNLENAELKNTFPLGVSNEWKEEKVQISTGEGILIVIQSLLQKGDTNK